MRMIFQTMYDMTHDETIREAKEKEVEEEEGKGETNRRFGLSKM